MSRTGPRNPHRSGKAIEPARFGEVFTDMRVPKPEELVAPIWVSSAAERQRRLEALSLRNAQADAAWDKALEPARLPLRHPDRVPYPEAVKDALAAYDAVIHAHR